MASELCLRSSLRYPQSQPITRLTVSIVVAVAVAVLAAAVADVVAWRGGNILASLCSYQFALAMFVWRSLPGCQFIFLAGDFWHCLLSGGGKAEGYVAAAACEARCTRLSIRAYVLGSLSILLGATSMSSHAVQRDCD